MPELGSMKPIVGSLGIAAFLLGVLSLTPGEWREKMAAWIAALPFNTYSPALLYALAVTSVVALVYLYVNSLRKRQEARCWRTRAQWWDSELPRLIAASEEMTIIDMYQGPKTVFWSSLENRLKSPRPFKLTVLDLATSDVHLAASLKMNAVKQDVIATDIVQMTHLAEIGAQHDKSVTFGFWDGLNHGPLVFWKTRRREYAASGFWQQIRGSTDTSPWIVTERGPLFESFTQHRDSILRGAKIQDNPCSSPNNALER